MRNIIGGVIALVAVSALSAYSQSRLARNDAIRRLPEQIKEATARFEFPPTLAELEEQMNWTFMLGSASIAMASHREEYKAEFQKQLRAASNGL